MAIWLLPCKFRLHTLFAEENPSPIRYALELIGLANGSSLLPLCTISAGLKEKLFKVMTDLHIDGILPVKPIRRDEN